MNMHSVRQMVKNLVGLVMIVGLAPHLWPKSPKDMPYQPVTFLPLTGTYVFRLEGMMDDKTFKHSLDSVELIPNTEKGGAFRLDRVQDSRSARFFKKDGSYVDGGFGSIGSSMETLKSFWTAGVRLGCPVDICALEVRNLGLVRERLDLPNSSKVISVRYRIVPSIDSRTKKIRKEDLVIDFATDGVDFEANYACSSDLSLIDARVGNTRQTKGLPSCGVFCNLEWTKYVVVVMFQGMKPYANVYEVGKGWQNSVGMVEKLFLRTGSQKE